jgi:hypothetical protein
MSTQLASPPIKARPKGAQAEAEPSVVKLPAPIYPYRAGLSRVLSDYEATMSGIAEYEAHIARCDVDEQSTIDAGDVSIADSSNRIERIQRDRGIYRVRLSAKQTAKTQLLKDMNAALRAGVQELNSLVILESRKRSDILSARIKTAGQLEDHGSLAGVLKEALFFSKPLLDVLKWQVGADALLLDGEEYKVGLGKRVLANYEGFLAEERREF